MKTNILNTILFAIIILANNSAHAALKRLNNTLGVVADYTTLATALSGQSTWDTLYVEPSATSYTVTATETYSASNTVAYLVAPNKVLIGNGYFLGNYPLPVPLQANNLSSKISGGNLGLIKIGNNITCIGLYFEDELYQRALLGEELHHINLISCYLPDVIFYSTYNALYPTKFSNIKIRKCYISNCATMASSGFTSGSYFDNFTFENNILIGSIFIQAFPVDNVNFIIRNNVIGGVYFTKDAYCANNIFLVADSSNSFFINNSVKNNLFVASTFGLFGAAFSANNQFNVNDSLLFNPINAHAGPDGDYLLWQGNSPAISAGVPNGATPVDCGAFGGPDPYRLSGIPPFPTIYTLTTPAVIQGGTSMNIIMSTRSNN